MLIALLWNLALTAGLAIVLTAVCCLRSMRNRPALRHLLWLLLLAKLVTPPLIPVPVLPADARSHDTAAIATPPNAATDDRLAGLGNVAQTNCYATTLLKALDFVQAEPYAPRAFGLGMGSGASILRRFAMIGDTQLSYRLSRWTLLILLLSVIPLVCLPVRAQQG